MQLTDKVLLPATISYANGHQSTSDGANDTNRAAEAGGVGDVADVVEGSNITQTLASVTSCSEANEQISATACHNLASSTVKASSVSESFINFQTDTDAVGCSAHSSTTDMSHTQLHTVGSDIIMGDSACDLLDGLSGEIQSSSAAVSVHDVLLQPAQWTR